ncbi:hypothetical protein OE88DRAFT_869179 [Heliocybe sulcata]|uniref:Uncharacterized protein n=1 Tax=Heliocybe sulcata TaxID=5364 RepID=A0A5C3MSW0_9AGAM|nr:hypothetical protein OE88DRAFT_869179 [Heliocybe sulcata]
MHVALPNLAATIFLILLLFCILVGRPCCLTFRTRRSVSSIFRKPVYLSLSPVRALGGWRSHSGVARRKVHDVVDVLSSLLTNMWHRNCG